MTTAVLELAKAISIARKLQAVAAVPTAVLQPLSPRPDEIRIKRTKDLHVHCRQVKKREKGNNLLWLVVRHHAPYFGHILAMPNTKPPIETGPQAVEYQTVIRTAIRESIQDQFGPSSCEPLVTIMLTDATTPDMIREAHGLGVIAAKFYPKGATTNSEKGVTYPLSPSMWPVYAAMAECGMVLCGHFEDPDGDIMDRERDYLPTVGVIARRWPKLRIVFEHVTDAATVEFILDQREGVAGTITPQHLILTRNDILGAQGLRDRNLIDGGPRLVAERTAPALRPHNYCLPVAKTMADRRALIIAATSGSRRFFLGTDTAVHDKWDKECARGCAGAFVPGKVALGLLALVFEKCGGPDWVTNLEKFASVNGALFYGLAPDEDTILLKRQDWIVPRELGGAVLFAAEHILPWEAFPNA
jgi:dihydroorotase